MLICMSLLHGVDPKRCLRGRCLDVEIVYPSYQYTIITFVFLQRIRPQSAPRERHVTSLNLKRDNSASPTRLSNHSHGARVNGTPCSTRLASSRCRSIGITRDEGGHVYSSAAKCLLESSQGNEKRTSGIFEIQRKNWENCNLQPQEKDGAEGGGGRRDRNRRQFRLLLESKRWSTGGSSPRTEPTAGAANFIGNKKAQIEETSNNGDVRIPRQGDPKGKAQVSVDSTNESRPVKNGHQRQRGLQEPVQQLKDKPPAIGMPQGHRVGVAEMEEVRKRRAAMRKGASFPLPRGMYTLDVTPNPRRSPELRPKSSKPIRPKSAEFFRDVHDLPCFTKTHSKSPSEGDQDIVKMIKAQLSPEKKKPEPELPAPSSPGTGILHKLFNFRKSPSRDKSPANKSVKTELHFVPITNPNNSDQTLSPTSVLNVNELEQEIRVRRYHSLPRRSIEEIRSPTPPIAIFSSDEDISSVPSTPKHVRSSRTSVSESSSKKSPPSSRPLTPEPEMSKDQIEHVLLQPPKYKTCCVVDFEKQSLCSSNVATDSLTERVSPRVGDVDRGGSQLPVKVKPKTRQKKYGAGPRHHSADVISYLPPPSPRTHAQGQPVYPKPRHKPDSKPTQLTYAKQRHHTIDLACIVITPPESSESSEQPDQVFPPGTPPEVTAPRPTLPSACMQPPRGRPSSTSSGLTLSRSSPQRRMLHSLSQDSASGPSPSGSIRTPKPQLGRHWSISEEVLQRGLLSSGAQKDKTVLPSGAIAKVRSLILLSVELNPC